jgi:hypothetical protein
MSDQLVSELPTRVKLSEIPDFILTKSPEEKGVEFVANKLFGWLDNDFSERLVTRLKQQNKDFKWKEARVKLGRNFAKMANFFVVNQDLFEEDKWGEYGKKMEAFLKNKPKGLPKNALPDFQKFCRSWIGAVTFASLIRKTGLQTSLNQILAPVEKDLLRGTDFILRRRDGVVILIQLKTGGQLDVDVLPLEEERGVFSYSGKLKKGEKRGMRQYAQELIQGGKATGVILLKVRVPAYDERQWIKGVFGNPRQSLIEEFKKSFRHYLEY